MAKVSSSLPISYSVEINHNETLNIQGGSVNERYHVDEDEKNWIEESIDYHFEDYYTQEEIDSKISESIVTVQDSGLLYFQKNQTEEGIYDMTTSSSPDDVYTFSQSDIGTSKTLLFTMSSLAANALIMNAGRLSITLFISVDIALSPVLYTAELYKRSEGIDTLLTIINEESNSTNPNIPVIFSGANTETIEFETGEQLIIKFFITSPSEGKVVTAKWGGSINGISYDSNLGYPFVLDLSSKEDTANKQNSLDIDGTGKKFITVDAVNIVNERVKVLESLQNLETNVTGKAYVVWTGVGLIFDVIYPDYYIQGALFPGATVQKTLDAADPDNPRQDVFALDVTGAIVKKGVASPDPVAESVDSQTEIYIATVFIAAGATTPEGVSNKDIYKNNAEFATSSNIATINFESINSPYDGIYCIETGTFTSGKVIWFEDSGLNQRADFDTLRLRIYLKANFNNNTKFLFYFFNGSSAVSNLFVLNNGQYGFSRTAINQWQDIIIPLSDFTFSGAEFDKFEIIMTGSNASGFKLDNIILNAGSESTNPLQKAITSIITDSGVANATTENDTFTFKGLGGLIISAVGKIITFTSAITDLSNYYTKSEVDSKLVSAYIFKGNKTDYADLVATGIHVAGYVYNLLDTGANYAWNGTDWDDLGGFVDISGKEDISNKTDVIVGNETSSLLYSSIKGIVDWLTASKIRSILGITTLSGSNTGDQDLSNLALKTFVEDISFQDINTNISAQTYVFELYAQYAYTINELKIISGAGTCTAAIQINGTNVTGISAVSVSSTIATGTASAANTVAVGNKITLVITSPTTLDNLQATLKTTRI